jgi:hypothetical protein
MSSPIYERAEPGALWSFDGGDVIVPLLAWRVEGSKRTPVTSICRDEIAEAERQLGPLQARRPRRGSDEWVRQVVDEYIRRTRGENQ